MNVILIGDSIRMFYEKEVQKVIGDGYQVFSPKENCRFSAYVLNSLRFWLNEFPTPDIIHFNAGLWDTAIIYKEDGCFTPLDTYVDYMKKILRVLRSTGATVLFATTTPVSDEKYKFDGPMPPAHRNEDIIRYNKAVMEAYAGEEVIINDLHALMYPERESLLRDDMIHPNDDGVQILGQAVAKAIMGVTSKASGNAINKRVTKRDEKTIQ